MEQLEEYPSYEQVTAVISPQNDNSQPDQSPFDGAKDSETLSANQKSAEAEKASDKNVRGNSRAASSQNEVSPTTSNSVTTITTTAPSSSSSTTITASESYTLPELNEEEENANRKAKPTTGNATTTDNLVDVISSGISDMKLTSSQVSVSAFFSIDLVDIFVSLFRNNRYNHQHRYQCCHPDLMLQTNPNESM